VDIEDIDEVQDIQERRVVVAGKDDQLGDDQLGDDQAEEDMRPVEGLVDRLELVPVLVVALLVFPMMLFLCYGQYKILFHLEFSFPPNQVVVVRQLMGLQQLLGRLHELFVQQFVQQLLVPLLLVVVEFHLLFQLGFLILP